MAGRPRKPRAMKVLQGSFREDRHGAEPDVPTKFPAPPASLNARQRQLWADLGATCGQWSAESDVLAFQGVVSLMDRVLTIQEAMQATDESGKPLIVTYTPSADGEPNAEPAANPLYSMELKTWTVLKGYIAITGLSPVDRAKVKTARQTPAANPLDRFIKKAAN